MSTSWLLERIILVGVLIFFVTALAWLIGVIIYVPVYTNTYNNNISRVSNEILDYDKNREYTKIIDTANKEFTVFNDIVSVVNKNNIAINLSDDAKLAFANALYKTGNHKDAIANYESVLGFSASETEALRQSIEYYEKSH